MNCKYCNRPGKTKGSLTHHENLCKQNPNKKELKSWDAERRLNHSKVMKVKHNNSNREFSSEKRKALSDKQIKFNKQFWTEEQKKQHSLKMKEIVLRNPESYLNKNIRGSRVKTYQSIDEFGNRVSFRGLWEVFIAETLDKEGIKWIKDKLVGEYEWNNTKHLYFADFYLPELNRFVEVKGYETERDRAKYLICKTLVVIRKDEIDKLKTGEITLKSLLTC